MGDVYKYAACTISADRSIDGRGGCFDAEFSLETRPCKLEIPGKGSFICVLREDLLQYELREEPLARRAWALQERVLSPRVLHCGREQFFWECKEHFTCHSYPHGFGKYGSNWNLDYPRMPLIAAASFEERQRECFFRWHTIVEEYSRRSLTKEDDKLIALSGLAKDFQKLLDGDAYIAGLWRGSLPGSLEWSADIGHDAYAKSTKRPTKYRAPSWSWASIDGEISIHREFMEGRKRGIGEVIFILRILDINIDLVSSDPMGQAKGGSLEVMGLMKRCILSKRPQHGYWLSLCEDLYKLNVNVLKYKRVFVKHDITSNPAPEEETYCLLIRSIIGPVNSDLSGLIVYATENPNRFRRFGTFQASTYRGCAQLKYNLLPSSRIGDDVRDPWRWFEYQDWGARWKHRELRNRMAVGEEAGIDPLNVYSLDWSYPEHLLQQLEPRRITLV